MSIGTVIAKLRGNANLSQEQFGELFGISRQSVQKWESDTTTPELEKLIRIAKYFDISLDALVLESDPRFTEELTFHKEIKPRYANLPEWESYSSNLRTEYRQCMEEGLELAAYGDVFKMVSRLPKGEAKKKLADTLFEVVLHAKTAEGYRYIEPSTLEEIRALRKPAAPLPPVSADLENKIHGAWLGRICGCLLGKAVECIHTDELIPFLQETGNYPMHRYIHKADLTEEILQKYKYRFANRKYADAVTMMPSDDDTNYMVLSQKLIEKYGRDFTSYNVSRIWLALQPKDAYCTAERVAFCNFVKGYEPPASAVYKNPFREWIGAQIRGDYFGYINPGDPQTAADMAFRDASISHVKNGIYGEMWVSAMLAAAACTNDIKAILQAGLAEIPHTSRLYEAIGEIITAHENGVPQAEVFRAIHTRFDEHNPHDWCHTISNAMIVAASLLYGEGDYGKSICMAVETGFDTDCNGATVGSVLGLAFGKDAIDPVWSYPIRDTLKTTIFGIDTVSVSACARKTMDHIERKPLF